MNRQEIDKMMRRLPSQRDYNYFEEILAAVVFFAIVVILCFT